MLLSTCLPGYAVKTCHPTLQCYEVRLVTEGDAVFAGLGGAEVNVSLGVVPDGLVGAVLAGFVRHSMAAVFQLVDCLAREAGFEMDSAAAADAFLAGGVGGAGVVDARGVAGFLEAHVEVKQVH